MGVDIDKTSSVPGGVTYASQDKLPKLPIPELEATCQRYLTALRPLQSAREHRETMQAVQNFLCREGPELQEELKKYAEGRTSYIEEFWYDSYLNFDNPVVLNLNPFFLLEDDPTPARNNQVTRAASLIVSALEFVRAVRREELAPDRSRGGAPLDMYQYSRLFGTARVPTEAGCRISQDPEARHIVVLARGQFYWFDVLDGAWDAVMTEQQIARNLQTILDDAAQTPIHEAAKGALGVLSTENRKVWSHLRDVLLAGHDIDKAGTSSNNTNADCLAIIDSALFIVCLDYTEPVTAATICGNMLCGTSEIERGVQIGTCTNRWYDKLQLIVCRNGSAGINFEHTTVDGHTVLRFASDLYTDTILRYARTINGQAPTLWATTSPDPRRRNPASFTPLPGRAPGDITCTPHKLEWTLTPPLLVAVRFAETRLADLIEQTEFRCLDLTAYGKAFIQSAGFSPDAFVQMSFQTAYYGLYGRVECTYEPAMTKAFLHGRTEAIRSVSEEAVVFVQTFWGEGPGAEKVEVLRRACERHVAQTKECARGEGCDRHLYALLCLWQRQQKQQQDGQSPPSSYISATLPSAFADAGWDKLNTAIMSTSNCGNPSLRHFGFGPTSGDGFGIGYIIKDERIAVCVSSKHRQTQRFVDTLEKYLLEIRRILRLHGAGVEKPISGTGTPGMELASVTADSRGGMSRVKSWGRMITIAESRRAGGTAHAIIGGKIDEAEDEDEKEGDDELGGYGFFDSGMLRLAHQVRNVDQGDKSPPRSSSEQQTDVTQARRGDIGKKLRLSEY